MRTEKPDQIVEMIKRHVENRKRFVPDGGYLTDLELRALNVLSLSAEDLRFFETLGVKLKRTI